MSLTRLMAVDTTPERLGEAPLDEPDPIEGQADEQDDLASGEFDDLMTSIGAEAAEPTPYDDLRLRDQMIAELSENLEMLKPIGDQLAATERSRMVLLDKLTNAEERAATLEYERAALLERLTDLEEHAARHTATEANDEHETELAALRRELESERKAKRRLEKRLARTKTKLDERHRTAADRWRKILDLKRERKELRRALKSSGE